MLEKLLYMFEDRTKLMNSFILAHMNGPDTFTRMYYEELLQLGYVEKRNTYINCSRFQIVMIKRN